MKLRDRPDTRASKTLPAMKKVLPEIPTDDDQLEQLSRYVAGALVCSRCIGEAERHHHPYVGTPFGDERGLVSVG